MTTTRRLTQAVLFCALILLGITFLVGLDVYGQRLQANQSQVTTLLTMPKFTINATSSLLTTTVTASPTVVFSELAWGGTTASPADEWLELYNTTPYTISLNSWRITSTHGLSLSLSGIISPATFFLIENTNDQVISNVVADVVLDFGVGLTDTGDTLFLIDESGLVVDRVNSDGGVWPTGPMTATIVSMERFDLYSPDSDTNWHRNDLTIWNGLDRAAHPINGTPGQPNSSVSTIISSPTPPSKILISEFLYDGQIPSTEGDEFVELCNPNASSVDLTGYKIGDEETNGAGEGMYQLPISTTLAADDCLVVAKNADQFQTRFSSLPDFELIVSSSYSDNPAIPNLEKYKSWAGGNWALANNADELLLLGPDDSVVDSVAYRNGGYDLLGLMGTASAPEPYSLQRVWPVDTASMPYDFVKSLPSPGVPTISPSPPTTLLPPASLPDGMYAYWGHLHAHTTYSDGAGPAHYALALARAAGHHFYAITDHGWWLTDLEWAETLTETKAATVPGEFIALRGIEWTHSTVGHINVFNTDTLLQRTSPLFAELPDFYTWLAANPEVIAQFNHPDPSYGGTFSNFAYHPAAAQVMFMQEIGNSSQGYVTYEPSFIQSNMVGWRTGPTNNGDTHNARWGSDTNARTGIVAPALTEADLLDAMRARRVFATEDSNLALTLRGNGQWMGTELPVAGPTTFTVNVVDPDPEPITLHLYDANLLVATLSHATSTTEWTIPIDTAPGHFYWVKAIQADGDVAYSTPIWIAGELVPTQLIINELLPAPGDVDWDGNGTADHTDEWIEIYNPTAQPVGLGGWRLSDASNLSYDIPLGEVIQPGTFAVFYQNETGFSLNNNGDMVTLMHPNGTIVDQVGYDYSPGYDDTWCRLPDGTANWSDNCDATPIASNREKPDSGGPLTVRIYEAKQFTYNAWVRVRGRVTAPPGLLGTRTMYIQDDTAGILIYLPKDHGFTFDLGDRIEVVGNIREFYDEFEIVVDERADVEFLEAGFPPPALPIATTSLLEPYEGRLVQLQGQAVGFRGRATMWLDDGTGWAKTYIRQRTGITKPFIEMGTPVTAIGIVSQRSEDTPSRDDYRLLLRYQSDLILPQISPTPIPTPLTDEWPIFLPDTGY